MPNAGDPPQPNHSPHTGGDSTLIVGHILVLGAHADLLIVGPLVLIQVALEAFDQFQDFNGWGHFVFLG